MTERHEIAPKPVNPWLVLAGVQPHGIKITRPPQSKEYARYKPPPSMRSATKLESAHTKTRRGIRACLRAGMLSNYDIRQVLIQRGFYLNKTGKALYASRFNVYVRLIREQLGLVRRAKKEWVMLLWEEGKDVATIAKRLNSKEDYVALVLRRDGRVRGLTTKKEDKNAKNT